MILRILDNKNSNKSTKKRYKKTRRYFLSGHWQQYIYLFGREWCLGGKRGWRLRVFCRVGRRTPPPPIAEFNICADRRRTYNKTKYYREMIKANELRIGNWIMINWSKEIKKADHLDIRDIIEDRIVGGISPIELTPEILEAAGFEWNGPAQWFELRDWLPFVIKEGKTPLLQTVYRLTTFKVDWNLAEIQYLHQLQNFYYSLVGEELTIKL